MTIVFSLTIAYLYRLGGLVVVREERGERTTMNFDEWYNTAKGGDLPLTVIFEDNEWVKNWLEMAFKAGQEENRILVQDLGMVARELLRKKPPTDERRAKLYDFLQRKGLGYSCLREAGTAIPGAELTQGKPGAAETGEEMGEGGELKQGAGKG